MIHSAVTTVARASLPWYDLPEIRGATDALWRELAARLRRAGLANVPRQLNRRTPYERQWTSPGFLFGQACGYDVRIAHARRLQVVATPCYDAPGCQGSNYSSFVVVREDSPFGSLEDLRGRRCVINTPTSHSGMNVLRALVAPLHQGGRFFSRVRVSGSHEASLRMIRRGDVDVAAIDAVTHALLARHRPHELEQTRVLCHTQPVAAPPYVTAGSTPADVLELLRTSLWQMFEDPSLSDARQTLLLSNIEILPEDAYDPIELLEAAAHGQNYRELPGPPPNAPKEPRPLVALYPGTTHARRQNQPT